MGRWCSIASYITQSVDVSLIVAARTPFLLHGAGVSPCSPVFASSAASCLLGVCPPLAAVSFAGPRLPLLPAPMTCFPAFAFALSPPSVASCSWLVLPYSPWPYHHFLPGATLVRRCPFSPPAAPFPIGCVDSRFLHPRAFCSTPSGSRPFATFPLSAILALPATWFCRRGLPRFFCKAFVQLGSPLALFAQLTGLFGPWLCFPFHRVPTCPLAPFFDDGPLLLLFASVRGFNALAFGRPRLLFLMGLPDVTCPVLGFLMDSAIQYCGVYPLT